MDRTTANDDRTMPSLDASADIIGDFVRSAHAIDLAAWLDGQPSPEVSRHLAALPLPQRADVFGYLPLNTQAELGGAMARSDLAEMIVAMDADDRADLFKCLTADERQQLLHVLPEQEREDIRRLSGRRCRRAILSRPCGVRHPTPRRSIVPMFSTTTTA